MTERPFKEVLLTNYKGRMRNRNYGEYLAGIQLKIVATSLISNMYEIYHANKIDYAFASLVGSVALNVSDDKSDFDYLIESNSRELEDVIRLVEITQDVVIQQIQSISPRRVEMNYPFSKIFVQAFEVSNRFRSQLIT